jgi:RNA polymerase-binding protein DksA
VKDQKAARAVKKNESATKATTSAAPARTAAGKSSSAAGTATLERKRAATAKAPTKSSVKPSVKAAAKPSVKTAAKPTVKAAAKPSVKAAANAASGNAKAHAPKPSKSTASKAAPAKSAGVKGATPKKSTVPVDENSWTAAELAEVRALLSEDVQRLRREILTVETDLADRMRDGGDGAGDDQADAGTKTFEREHEMSLANNARDLVAQAELAISRIDAGTYGRCDSCGNPIAKLRLQANPRATLCVSCKQREERR